MKVIIRETRITELAIKWLDYKFPDLFEKPSHRKVVSYVSPTTNFTIFDYDTNRKVVMFYGDAYSTLNTMFDMQSTEVKSAIKQWISDYYGLDVSRVTLFLK